MRLQTATRIAIYAVTSLAAVPGGQLSAGEIAQRFGISVNHLGKVLQTLHRAGLVEALRGVNGGHRFRGNPRRVTLLDVIELFEEVGHGPPPRSSNPARARALDRVLDEIDQMTRATLGSITIATLLKIDGWT
jgi:Rrf2 family nitric oxide-sensitive transcriptional repressor